MKVFNTVLKILAALAVVAGIDYVIATYGDKIVAWAKSLFYWCKEKCCCCCCEPSDEDADALTPEEAAIGAEESDFENE